MDDLQGKQKTKNYSLFFIVLSTIFASAGQLLWKGAAQKIILSNPLTILNLLFILGLIAYGSGLMFMLLAFKQGELSVLYPILATSYVWISILSPYFFPNDTMSFWKWLGVILIVISVSLLGWSSNKNNKNSFSKNSKIINQEAENA